MGCGTLLLAVLLIPLCLFMPFIGLPLGLVLVVTMVIASFVRKKSQDAGL